MKRTMMVPGLVGILVLAASAAFAWGPGWGRGFGPGYRPALPVANLTADQIAKIEKIRSDRYAAMAKLSTELFAKGAELEALFREPALDQAKIAAKQKEIVALQAQMQEKALAARAAVAELLTPEQRAQLPASGPGMGPGFGPGHGFGPRIGFGPQMGYGPPW